MINMDYSADLPINTMGRRIRTRLYFTSESHLHTVLNSFRYANFGHMKPLLSEHGISVINATPELCYLTQIVIRVFEDNRRDMKDPRRFRIEILFSPGATSTPLRMHELRRDEETSRLDTAPLQIIGREGLTCQEMEDFFEQAINAGRTEDEDLYEMASTSTAAEGVKKSKSKKSEKKDKKDKKKMVEIADPPPSSEVTSKVASGGCAENETPPTTAPVPQAAEATQPKSVEEQPVEDQPVEEQRVEEQPECAPSQPETSPTQPAGEILESGLSSDIPRESDGGDGDGDDIDLDKERSERVYVARKYFWSAVAAGCLTVGVGCLYAALHFTEDSRPQRRRWETVRRY
jgi:inositol hexakisphosphate/diphosphoinositol-pentakisphosphate kinase